MASAPTTALSHRHAQVRRAFVERGLDALVVTSLPNVLYLTNFSGSSAIVVMGADRLRFLTDSRYLTTMADMARTTHACPGLDLSEVGGSYDVALLDHLRSMTGARVGVEGGHLSVSRFMWLTERLAGEPGAPALVPIEGLIEAARVTKDPHELLALEEGGRRLSRVAAEIVQEVRAGRQEREVAMAIDWAIRAAGFERTAFETIVAGGANAALPHARPGERRLDEGDLVVLDFGGVYDSYCVDLTRTVCIGRPSSRARDVHAAVLAAHDRAISVARPGVSTADVDAAARSHLTDVGMGEAFGHGTGHGLGIEVHEAPRVARRRPGLDGGDDRLRPGMVFTVEPGAYFPGWGGVRIEDDVVVTEDGVRLLTNVTTELLEL